MNKMGPTSVDPKPLFAPHGTIIQEEDTKDYYIFDAGERMWLKIMEPLQGWLKMRRADNWCENWKPIVNSKPIEEKKMKYDSFDELCPHCGRILRGYEGLKECFCKFCGGKILR